MPDAPTPPVDAPTVPAMRYAGPGGEFIVPRSARAMVHQSAIIEARQMGHYADAHPVDAPADTAFYTG